MNAITQILSFKSKVKRDVYEAVVTGKDATSDISLIRRCGLCIEALRCPILVKPYVNEV
jgi:hypothetical protein